MITIARVALAALSGILLAASFPPIGWSWLVFIGIGLLILAAWNAKVWVAAVAGFVAGLVFFGSLVSWLSVVGVDAWLLLAAYCAVWIALGAMGTALVSRLPFAPVWITAVWVLEEALRSRIPFGGFPWGSFGFALSGTAVETAASLGGVSLLTAIAVVVPASIVWLVLSPSPRRFVGSALVWVTSILLVVIGGLAMNTDPNGQVTVAYVQGGVPEFGLGSYDNRREVLDNHVRATLDLAGAIGAGDAPQPSFVLWPENSSDIDPFKDPEAADAISAAAGAVGVPILVGAVIDDPNDPDHVLNVGIVWDPVTGPGEMYVKTHPVPFGEYIPFRDQIADLVGRFDMIPRDFAAGDRAGNLTVGGVPIGNVICFEIAYDEVVRDVVSGGAQLITVQTNNATYGGTGQPEQQLAITRVRAIEHGRSVVVASTSGISGAIVPTGEIVSRMDEGQSGWRVVDLPLRTGSTPAERIGDIGEWVIALLGVFGVAFAIATRRRNVGLPRD